MTSKDIRSTISSPASAAGAVRYDSRIGPIIEKFGLEAVLASLSPSRAKEVGLLTTGTSGRISDISSRSAALQSSLESRLRQRLNGSDLCEVIWKPWTTPWGAMPVEAASAGADHLRDRFWFVGHDPSDGRSEGRAEHELRGRRPTVAGDGGMEHAARISEREPDDEGNASAVGGEAWPVPGGPSFDSGRLANARRGRRSGSGEGQDQFEGRGEIVGAGGASNLADYYYSRSQGRPLSAERPDQWLAGTNGLANPDFACEVDGHEQRNRQLGGTGGDPQARDGFAWVLGADGKARRVKPGICLLAHGVPNRVGKLRGFGNAIDPRPAAAFIQSVKDIIDKS